MDIVDDAAVAVVDVVQFLMDWTESQRLLLLFACLNLAPLDLGHPWRRCGDRQRELSPTS